VPTCDRVFLALNIPNGVPREAIRQVIDVMEVDATGRAALRCVVL